MLWKFFTALLVLLISIGSFAQDKEGQLYISAFQDGKPFRDFKVSIAGDTKNINDDGEVTSSVAPGATQFTIFHNDRQYTRTANVVAGTRTIVLINFDPGKTPKIDVEEPLLAQEISSDADAKNAETYPLKISLISVGTREPVAGAKIFVKGQTQSATTNREGEATIEMPAGQNSFSVIHPQFASLNLKEVEHGPDAKPMTLALSPSGVKMDEFVVTAPHIKGSMASLMDDRRLASEVVDVIGAEQMSRSGDGDAAAAIRRVTGMTLESGRYPFIRGMGDRYVTSLLNGFNLPSPNPTRRVVPLDMFPTGILQGISVLKSSGADRFGEFGGGHILLETKAIPDQLEAKISMSSAINDGDTEALTYDGGQSDWLGIDDGTRELPQLLESATSGNTQLTQQTIVDQTGLTAEELQSIGQSLNNNYNISEQQLPLSNSISASLGNRYELFDGMTAGFTLSGLYGDDWQTVEQRRAEYPIGGSVDPEFTTIDTERLIKVGASGSFGIDFGENHKLRSFLSLLRRTSDETEFWEGNQEDWDGPFRQYILRWQEREMVLQQFWGEHQIPFLNDMKIDWRVGLADASMYQPDTREYRYGINNGEWAFASQRGGNKRNFSELYDRNEEAGLDITQPVIRTKPFSLKLKAGLMQIDRSRQAKTRRFGFQLNGTMSAALAEQDLETILAPENINASNFVLQELTIGSDTYIGLQELSAQYAMLDMNIYDRFTMSAGLRNEQSNQYVRTFNLFDPSGTDLAIARLNKEHALPAFNSALKITELSQLRFSYGKSIARPDFRELSPAPYIDDETGLEIIGNPDLDVTEITAYDMRYEWYNNTNESLSLALFHKQLANPIEVSITPGTFQQRYELAESAEISGVELEWHHNLSRWTDWLKGFRSGGNIAYMQSQVTLSEAQRGVQTNESRALQGQSPYVLNLYLFYTNYKSDTEAGILFNQLGPRISGVGTLGNDDYFEQPIAQLDLTASQRFWENYKVSMRVRNILGRDAIEKQASNTTRYRQRPRELSIGLTATF